MDKEIHQGKTDRELLLETRTDVDWLKSAFERHLDQHHKMYLVTAGAVLSFLGAVLLLTLR